MEQTIWKLKYAFANNKHFIAIYIACMCVINSLEAYIMDDICIYV